MSNYQALKEKHSREQQATWHALKKLLVEYKTSYGISVTEVAEGLDVSRQFIHNFMSDPVKHSLNKINRADLLNLWAYVTDPVNYENRKLTQEHRTSREALKKEGADKLLKTAGFLPDKDMPEENISIPAPIKRVLSRLSSRWIQDEVLREYIINGILDQVLDQGRMDTDFYVKPLNFKNKKDRQEIHGFPDLIKSNLLSDQDNHNLSNKYNLQINLLVRSGKTLFVKSELFELYQSIVEHDILSQEYKGRAIISDCQFETISPAASIFKKFHVGKETFNSYRGKSLQEYEIEAESSISSYEEDFENNFPSELYGESQFPRLTKAKVTCSFVRIDEERKYIPEGRVFFEKISTATHIENMLIAVKRGLGHDLNIAGFFIRATGRTAKSLARVSIGLEEEKEYKRIYQGWWVSSNTITGILRAVEDAFIRYLNDNSIDEIVYNRICFRIADIKTNIEKVTAFLYEGKSDFMEDHDEINEFSLNLLNEIDSIKSEFNSELIQQHNQINIVTLSYLAKIIKLISIHASFIKGDLKSSKKFLDEIQGVGYEDVKSFLLESGKLESNNKPDPYKWIISIHEVSCILRSKMITGDKQFLYGKLWRHLDGYSLSTFKALLKNYTEAIGSVDFEAYFCASQIFGIIAQLDLYSLEATREELEESVENLLKAAHYSYRIGHFRRSSQWIINAVRICCRLGREKDVDNANKLMALASETTQGSDRDEFLHKQAQSSGIKSNDWLTVNTLIASGEIDLINKNYDRALVRFFDALIIIYEVEYMRMAPDCLYNIHRAIDRLIVTNFNGENPIKRTIEGPLGEKVSILNTPKILSGGSFKDTGADWQSFSADCKNSAASLWNEWARSEGYESHPFAEAICENDDFLQTLAKDEEIKSLLP